MVRQHKARRNAFTLIELLVVIAIIVILMSLTLVVISRIWRKIDDSATQVDISKLSEAAEQFKSSFGRYPPGRLLLCERPDGPFGWTAVLNSVDPQFARLANESIEFLTAIFPGIELLNASSPITPFGPNLPICHDWAGRGQDPIVAGNRTGLINPNGANAIFLLEGSEVMVYLLGGMRYSGGFEPLALGSLQNWLGARTGPLGWNTNKQRPCAPPPLTGGPARLGPYFAFDETRINYPISNPTGRQWNAEPGVGPSGLNSRGYFPVYLDRYGEPYLYFRAQQGGGGINNYRFRDPTAPTGGAWYMGAGNLFFAFDNFKTHYDNDVNSPVPGLRGMFVPYWESCTPPQPVGTIAPNVPGVTGAKFFKPDRFQIISAGRDRQFGRGGRLDPSNPEQFLTDPRDFDNITNVTEGPIKP